MFNFTNNPGVATKGSATISNAVFSGAFIASFITIVIGSIWFTHSQAAVYKQVDDQGNITYSDVATKKDEKPITPPKVMTFKPLATPQQIQETQSKRPASNENASTTRYLDLQIAQPGNDQTIRANGGILSVQLTANPELNSSAGHHYVLLVSGKARQSSTTPGFKIGNIDRGSHTLTAQIQDRKGNILANSSTITVHVLRASVLRP